MKKPVLQSARDLTTGALAPQIVRFSLPLIFSNLLQVMFNMADVAVVGRFAGPLALGAVGSTSTLVVLFTGLLLGMADAVNVQTATFFGARDKRALDETIHTAAVVLLLVGILLLTAGSLLARPILTLMNTKPELIEGAMLYLRIYFLGMPAAALFNLGNAVLSAVGNTRLPLMYLSAAGVVNVLLNLVFVIVLYMDVAGVALASTISQYLSAGLVIRALLRSGEEYGLHLNRLRLIRSRCRAILGLGLPASLQYSIFTVANMFVQSGINTFDAVMVAGNSAATNADSLINTAVSAFYTACGSFIGQNYGAGKKERVRQTFLLCAGFACCAAVIVGGGLLAMGRPFLSLFTGDAAVVEAGLLRMQVICPSYIIAPFMDCPIAASRGLGKSLGSTIIVITGSCIFRILWIYTVFAWVGTPTSLYLLYPCSWTITAVAEMLYFRSVYRNAAVHMA